MKNWKRVAFVLFAVSLVLTTTVVGKAGATTCYIVYYNWDCNYDYDYNYKSWPYYYLAVHMDGTFDYYEAGDYDYGEWGAFGSSMYLKYESDSGCKPLLAGTKKQGFMNCTDGYDADYLPGCYYMKKAKIYNCEEGLAAGPGVEKSSAGETKNSRGSRR